MSRNINNKAQHQIKKKSWTVPQVMHGGGIEVGRPEMPGVLQSRTFSRNISVSMFILPRPCFTSACMYQASYAKNVQQCKNWRVGKFVEVVLDMTRTTWLASSVLQ